MEMVGLFSILALMVLTFSSLILVLRDALSLLEPGDNSAKGLEVGNVLGDHLELFPE